MSFEVSHTGWEELVPLLEKASAEDHHNSVNYSPEKMEKRWENYKEFNILRSEGKVVAFGGVYAYGEELVRVVDRFYIFPEYRTRGLAKLPRPVLRPGIDGLIPYQTEKYSHAYECFISVQEKRKRNFLRKHAEKMKGYTLLPDMYWTSEYREPTCLQSVAATNGGRITRALLAAESSPREPEPYSSTSS